MFLLTLVTRVHAVPIGIDLGRSRVLTGTNPATNNISFDALNGTPLIGNVSVDVRFNKNQFVRLFTATQPLFDALLTFETNGSGFVGFLQGTGYLLDAQGDAIPGFGVTGSASGNDASISIGLFPLLKDQNGTPNIDLARPFDFYGVHYDLTFPMNPSVQVTGGQFLLAGNGIFTPFAIGPGRIPRDIVAETNSTLVFLVLGLCGVIGVRARVFH
jgi:hypothetical protein